jgi:hypothetical protein
MSHLDIENLILPTNSCPIQLDSKSRAGIRVRVQEQNIVVDVKHAGDASYKKCNTQQLIEASYKPFFGLVASNKNGGVNDIDINAIFVKNMD